MELQFHPGPARKLSVWHIPLLSVQWITSWWWTDELSETCRVSWQNKFVKLVHQFWSYYKGICYDARSHGRKILPVQQGIRSQLPSAVQTHQHTQALRNFCNFAEQKRTTIPPLGPAREHPISCTITATNKHSDNAATLPCTEKRQGQLTAKRSSDLCNRWHLVTSW